MSAVYTRSSNYGFRDVTSCGTRDGYRSDGRPAGTIFSPEGRVRSSETLVHICLITRCHKPEDHNINLRLYTLRANSSITCKSVPCEMCSTRYGRFGEIYYRREDFKSSHTSFRCTLLPCGMCSTRYGRFGAIYHRREAKCHTVHLDARYCHVGCAERDVDVSDQPEAAVRTSDITQFSYK